MLPLLVRVDNLQTQTSTHFAYDRSPVRIGRNQLNDLAFDQPFVSQWHALVRFDDYATQYFDLGSTNGTIVNGQRVGKNVPVAVDGQTEVRIGSLRIYFWRGQAPPHLLNAQRAATFTSSAPSTQVYDRTTVELGLLPGDAGQQAVQHARQMSASMGQIKPYYDAYRQSWVALQQRLFGVIGQFPEASRAPAVAAIQREMPHLANEEEFRNLATQYRVGLSGSGALASSALQLLTQFAQYYVPSGRAPSTPQDLEKLLARVAIMMEAYSKSFVELRKGQEQFASEMALRSAGETTPLHTAKDAREAIAYLLDWTVEGSSRIQELTSAFADIMIHQVALLNGLMEGVRGLLHRLSPAEIEREVSGGWPFRASALWRRYTHRHREFVEEDRQITAAVFGAEFARAYASVVGEQYDESGGPGRSRRPAPGTVRMTPEEAKVDRKL